MAHIENITVETELSEFLTEEQITEMCENVEYFKTKVNELKTMINEEISNGGLSEEVYKEGDESPLYKEAQKILKPFENADVELEKTQSLIEKNGNAHRVEEAKKYLNKWEEKFNTSLKELKSKVIFYNSCHQNPEDAYNLALDASYDYIEVYGSETTRPVLNHKPQYSYANVVENKLAETQQIFDKMIAARLYLQKVQHRRKLNLRKFNSRG